MNAHHYQTAKQGKNSLIDFEKLTGLSWIVLAVYLIIGVIGLWQFYLPYAAERHFREGFNIQSRGDYFVQQNSRTQAVVDYKACVEEYLTTMRLAPWETYYLIQLGKAYESLIELSDQPQERLNYLKKAEDLYKYMLSIDDRSPWYMNRLSTIYQTYSAAMPEKRQDYLKQAEYWTVQAAKSDHRNPLFQMNMAFFYHRNGDFDRAEKYYLSAIEMDDQLTEARYNLADVYQRRNQLDNALQQYEAIYKYNPKFQNLRLALGRLYYVQKKYPQAAAVFEMHVSENPFELNGFQSLMATYYSARDWQSLIRVGQTAVLRFPQDTAMRQYYIQGLLQTGQGGEALRQAQRLAGVAPKS